ncbi:MAG: tetratricopeptide repeat protein, partial [Candidatus Hodarchaeota archaeon]
KELARAEALMKKGKHKDALELVRTIATQEGVSVDERLTCLLLECQIRIKLGEMETAITLIEEVQQTSNDQKNVLLVVEALNTKAEIFWRLGRFEEGLRAVKEGEELLPEIDIEEIKIKRKKKELLKNKGIIYWYKGDLDQALKYHQQDLEINKELGDKQGISDSFNNLGLVHWSKGNFDQAIEYYQQSLEIGEELGVETIIAAVLNNLGNVYQMKGDHDQAMESYQRSLTLRKKGSDKYAVALSLINLGVSYRMRGDLIQAQEYYQQSQTIFKDIGNKKGVALALNNLGDVYSLKGELNLALKHFQESLQIYEELGIRQDFAMSLGNIGEIYQKKGDLNQALKYYQQSLRIYEDLGNDPSASVVLSHLVWLALDNEDTIMARLYLQNLEQINERTNNLVINQRYRLAKALSLKMSKRARHKVKAAEILEQLTKEDITDSSLTISAMIHLCDLLLSELKATGEEEVLREVRDLTQRLLDIAKLQSSHSLLVETYLLQSKLALIELDVERAEKLLIQALNIAEDKGLNILARKVRYERESIQSQLHKWETIIKQNPSKREMINITHLDDLLDRMVRKTVSVLSKEEKEILDKVVPKQKYKLEYQNLIKDTHKIEKDKFRVAIAQIGLSQKGNFLKEFYEETTTGFFKLQKSKVKTVRSKIRKMIENASYNGVNILVFPELSIDLNYDQLREEIINLAKNYNIYIIPGSYHDQVTKQNICLVIGPEGILWQQEKHIPAIIHHQGKRFKEGIEVGAFPRKTVISSTKFGTIAIIICRDFLDMDLRVELKNSDPPVDLIINPAFTPVTDDFRAAHFDARRSIYAYCFFANIAEIGDSFIFTPEKERVERTIPPKEESLIYKDVNLFKLRSERKKWEVEHAKQRSFIQSTRL